MKKLLLAICSLMIVFSVAGCCNRMMISDNAVIVAKEVDVTSLDTSIAADGMSFEVIAAIIEGLYTVDKDGKVVPALTAEKSVSEDGKTHTFKLKDAMWSDGTPVTAHDFVFAWRRLADPTTASE